MFELGFWLSLFALLVFLVLLIVCAIRKKPKKGALLGIVASCVVFAVCVACMPPSKPLPPHTQPVAQAVVAPTEAPWKRLEWADVSVAYPPDWEENRFAPKPMKMVFHPALNATYLSMVGLPGEGKYFAELDESIIKLQYDSALSIDNAQIESFEKKSIGDSEIIRAVVILTEDDAPKKKALLYHSLVLVGNDTVLITVQGGLDQRDQLEEIFKEIVASITLGGVAVKE